MVLALPLLAFIVVAAAAMLFVSISKHTYVTPLQGLLRFIPIIGGGLADDIGQAFDTLQATLQRQLDQSVQAITDMIDFASGSVQVLLNAAIQGGEWLGHNLGFVAQTVATQAGEITTMGRQLLAAIQDAADTIARVARDVISLSQQLANALTTTIPGLIAQQLANVQHLIDSSIHAVVHPLRDFVKQVQAEAHTLVQTEAGVRATADTSIMAALKTAESAIEIEIGDVRTAVLRKLGTETGTLQQELQGILDVIGTVAAGTTVVGLIEAVATEVTTMERECVDPTCGFLGPQLPILNALGDAATLAIVGGMIATAATNPRAGASAAASLWNTLGPMVSDLLGTVTGGAV